MADIFREVDEEIRRDKAMAFWSRYQNWIIALALVVVAATGGWRWYQYQRRVVSEEFGAKFEAASQLARAGKAAEAEGAFETIARTGPAGYALLARLRAAAEASVTDKAKAIKLFDAIGADSTVDVSLRQLAQLRAAIIAVDSENLEALRKRLEPLATTEGVYRHTAREVLALAAYKAEDFDSATAWLDRLIADSQTPASLRQRANTLQAIVASAKPAKK